MDKTGGDVAGKGVGTSCDDWGGGRLVDPGGGVWRLVLSERARMSKRSLLGTASMIGQLFPGSVLTLPQTLLTVKLGSDGATVVRAIVSGPGCGGFRRLPQPGGFQLAVIARVRLGALLKRPANTSLFDGGPTGCG